MIAECVVCFLFAPLRSAFDRGKSAPLHRPHSRSRRTICAVQVYCRRRADVHGGHASFSRHSRPLPSQGMCQLIPQRRASSTSPCTRCRPAQSVLSFELFQQLIKAAELAQQAVSTPYQERIVVVKVSWAHPIAVTVGPMEVALNIVPSATRRGINWKCLLQHKATTPLSPRLATPRSLWLSTKRMAWASPFCPRLFSLTPNVET